jgi:hypothetical protein
LNDPIFDRDKDKNESVANPQNTNSSTGAVLAGSFTEGNVVNIDVESLF